jgi:uncharacterized protein
MKVSIDLGSTVGGAPATLDLEELLATRLLVQGNSGSGKSHLLRRLLEQSATWIQQAVIDPEGDFVTLAEAFGHVVVEASAHNETSLQGIGVRVRQHRVSVVLNVEGLDADLQMKRAASFLGGLFDTARDYWTPMLVAVDEAQLFAPAVAGEVSDEARRASLGAMTNLMCRGRKRGLAGIIATQRLAKLAKNVAAEASNFLMGRTFLDIDMARAADLLGMERRQAEMFRDLDRGQFMALGPALARRPNLVRVGEVQTTSRSGGFKLMPLPETPRESARDLILTSVEAPAPVQPVRPPPRPPVHTMAAIERARAAPAVAFGPTPDDVLAEILDETGGSARSSAVLYQDFLVRCRRRGVLGTPVDIRAFRRKVTAARAGLDIASEHPDWAAAVVRAEELPDEMHRVFFLFVKAAIERAPCPSDADIARALGSHSLRRGRRAVEFLAERGYVEVRIDAAGLRVVSVSEIERDTAPGDPNAAEPPLSVGTAAE